MAIPPDFSAGAVLTAAQMNAIGLWEIKTQTIGTTVTEVEVTSAFSTDYDSYLIVINGGAASTANLLRFQLGATTTGYYTGYSGVTYATAAATIAADNNGANFSAVGIGTTSTLGLQIWVTNPFLTEHTYVGGFHADATVSRNYAGYLNNTTSYTSFKIITSTGTMTGGTIRVYGYRK